MAWEGHTDRQTDGHVDSLTNSALWVKSVNEFAQITAMTAEEEKKFKKYIFIWTSHHK